jgi:hypothetical protein
MNYTSQAQNAGKEQDIHLCSPSRYFPPAQPTHFTRSSQLPPPPPAEEGEEEAGRRKRAARLKVVVKYRPVTMPETTLTKETASPKHGQGTGGLGRREERRVVRRKIVIGTFQPPSSSHPSTLQPVAMTPQLNPAPNKHPAAQSTKLCIPQ